MFAVGRCRVGRGRLCALVVATIVQPVVVDALQNEDAVGEAEVYGESYYRRHKPGPGCAQQVRDITHEPDGEEEERDAIGRLKTVVFNQLRNL